MSDDPFFRLPSLYLVPGFLDPATCLSIQTAMDRGTAEPAEVFDPDASLDLDARRAASIDIDPVTLECVEEVLDAARAAIAAYYHLALVSREGPGFLRYGPGGFYRRHRDRAEGEVDPVLPAWPGAARRLVSLIVFLNSSRARPAAGEFSGGELLIYPESDAVAGSVAGSEGITVAPCRGSLVAFDAATLHEVRPVVGGIRDVIVDWYY